MAQKIGLEAILNMSNFNKGMSQYDAGISQMESKTSGLASKLKGFAGTIGVGIAGAAAVGGTALIGLGGALGKLALDAAPLEGIGQAFDVMSEKAGLSLDELKKASRGTVSEFDLMRSANVALSGAGDELGKEFGKNLPKLMEIAQASARATGQDAGFLFESLVTGIKRTSPMLIDNTGLQLKLGEANDALAAQLGKSVDELTGEERQIALLNATMQAGQAMVDDFGGGQLTAAESMAAFKASIQDTKDQIGLAMLPALQAVLTPLGELAKTYGPAVVEWAKQAGQWLGEHIPIAIEKLAQFWTGTLQPALQTVWDFIQNSVIPILKDVWNWLATNIPPALEALAGFWTNTLQPALEAVWDFIEQNVIPILKTVWEWLSENIPPALKALAGFWEDTLLPAIKAVWSFIQQYIVPLFKSIVEVGIAALSKALEALAGLWENVLKPAIDVVWQVIQGPLKTAFEAAVEFFRPVREAIDGIGGAIDSVIGWLGDLADLITGIQLPDWLTPGSPTPFELGLRGISSALKEIATTTMPRFETSLAVTGASMPAASSPAQSYSQPVSPAVAAAGARTTNTSIGGDTINVAVTDTLSAALVGALVQDSRRGRLDAFAGA